MNKVFKINLIAILLIFFTACTPNYYYLKPEAYGQLIDQKTKQPISNTEGFIGYNLNDDKKVRTNHLGYFKITPKAESYYFLRPNMKKLSLSAPYIYVYFDGYKPKTIDYSNGELMNKIEGNPGGEILEKVDIGIIYLDPE